MSFTNLHMPQVTKNFGRLNKIIWFNMTNDVDGTFTLNLYITPSQDTDTTVVVFNKATEKQYFNKLYTKSTNSNIITETVKILHIPGLNSTVYGIKSI
jgi:hypothetical protein